MTGKRDNLGSTFARYLSVALLLPASTMGGYAIGYGIDRLAGTHIFKIVFLLLGTAGGFVELIRVLTKSE
ncbi:MAG TPA: AtpZ/AtpI family protein [Bryobacteraceae bacterium]|nr:AtpZ/AtpI family protein [Bryobacteraceae bacterium]